MFLIIKLDIVERLTDVGDEVVGIFDTAGETNKVG